MRKTRIALALALAIPVVWALGAAAGGHGHKGDRLERMAEKLELSEAQKTEVEALFETHRAERQALRERMHAQLGEVLTAEQLAKMEGLRDEHRKRWREKHKRHVECPQAEEEASG